MLRLTFAILATVFWLATPECFAQQGSRSGGISSGANQSTAGFAGLGNSAGGVNTTGFSLSNRFQSNFGRFTGGSQAIGQTTAGAAAATSGVYGQSSGTNGRSGLTNLGGRSSFGSGFSSLGRGFGAGLGYGMSPFGMSQFGRSGRNTNGNNQNRGVVRTHLKLGPELARVRQNLVMKATPKILRNTTQRLNNIMARSGQTAGPIALELKDGRVVLTGRVRTEHARKLAETLARLEPGIWELENALIVDPDAPTRATEPKPNAAGPHQ